MSSESFWSIPTRSRGRPFVGSWEAMSAIWLTEVFTTYQNLGGRVKEIGAHLTIVALDHDPNQAIELIQAMSQADPNAVILPASRTSDSTLILRAIRAGAREFLTLPTEPGELLETVDRILRGRLDSSTVAG